MSGHSKWSTIKRKKGALDAKRGKIFTKLIKEVAVAVREGGPDPEGNPRLRLAIQNAKGANMPKDNIERAIRKSAGAEGSDFYEPTYEAYAPHGIPIFIECATDNLNRTIADVRAILNKLGGSLGTNGSLEFIFDRKGVFTIKIPENINEDDFTLELIDAGAEEVEFDDGYINIIGAMEAFGNIQKLLDDMNVEVETSELQRIPKTRVLIEEAVHFQEVMKLIDALEDNDDVQRVYHNIDFTEAQLEQL